MKYTFEEKLSVIANINMSDSAIRSRKSTYRNSVKFWAGQYRLMGEDGIRHHEFNRVYSPEEKMRLIEPVLMFQVSLAQQASRVGINAGQLLSWIKRYKENGPDGLKCSKRGRHGKNMETIVEEKDKEESASKPAASEENVQGLVKRNKELEHKILLLEAEIDYRKKLHALAERKRRQEQSKKQRLSPSSSKAKNTGKR